MLEGLRVFDLTATSNAFCARVLADLGADVVRGPWSDDQNPRPPHVGDRSAYALALNANKRIVDIKRVGPWRVISDADVVITDQDLVYENVAGVNSRAILVTITPYGTSGPLGWVGASDIEVTAASGCLWLAGEPGRTPVRTTLPQSPFWTGLYAAMGALMALAARAHTGRGQHVAVAAPAAMATVHPPAILFWNTLREEHRRLGPYLIGRSIVGAKFRNIWPCADGHVAFAVQGGPIGRHTGRMLADWMRERDALDAVVGAIDWDSFDNRIFTQPQVGELEASIAGFLATLTKREFFAGVIARNMLDYPVSDARDTFADEQLKARDFWQELELGGRRVLFPGGVALFDGERPRIRAMREDETEVVWKAEGVGASIAQRGVPVAPSGRSNYAPGPREHSEAPAPDAPPPAAGRRRSALDGIRVVELGWAAAGPLVGKYLANHGAEVIHVELRTVLHAVGSTYPPFH